MQEKNNWQALFGVGLASFLGCVDFTIVNTALPDIQQQLGGSFTQLQWVMNIFVIALSAVMITMGRMGDILGHRRIFYSGLLVFALASLLAGMADSLPLLIAGRLFQGLACAVLFTNSGALVAHAFPASQQGRALGMLFGINGFGLAIGPFLGGVIVAWAGWRWVFLINIPIVALSILVCLRALGSGLHTPVKTRIDVIGSVLLTLLLACVALVFVQGGQWGWASAPTLVLIALAVGLALTFYWVERRVEHPILDLGILSRRPFFCSAVASFTLGAFYCLAFFLMPLYLDLVLDLKGLMLGVMLLPTTAGVALISPFVGRWCERWGTRPLILLGLGLFVVSALMQSAFAVRSEPAFVLLAFLAMGLGWGCILSPSTTAAVMSLPREYTGAAVGTLGSVQNIGGSLGLTLGIYLFNTRFAATLSGEATLGLDGIGQLPASLSRSQGISLDQAHLQVQHMFLGAYGVTMIALAGLSLLAMCYLALRMENRREHVEVAGHP